MPQMLGEGLFENFRAVAQETLANPLHLRVPLAVHGTKGARKERE